MRRWTISTLRFDPTTLTYDQALEEALAHGWIDGQVQRGDAHTYRQRFTHAILAASVKRNVEIVERLMAEGRMHPAGIAAVERAQADGRWQTAYAGPASVEVPDGLRCRSRCGAGGARCSPSSAVRTATQCFIASRAPSGLTPASGGSSSSSQCLAGETIHPQKRTLAD